jgi:hypothetical protein
MAYPYRPTGAPALPGRTVQAGQGPLDRSGRRPQGAVPLTRRYEVAALDASGSLVSFTRAGPALPLFEEAFTAFARGSLVQTPDGPVAVDDLVPGMSVSTPQGAAPVLWIGSVLLAPQPGGGEATLFRIEADTFGLDRPGPDLLLGPAARLLRPVRSAPGGQALVPVADLEGLEGVIRLCPATPVRLYHLALETQAVLKVNGLELESFHPGPLPALREAPEMLAHFLSLFPQISDPADFGRLAHPRLARGEYAPPQAA